MGLRTLPSERQGDHLEIEHVPAMQERNAEELRGTRQNKAARAGCNNPAMARLSKGWDVADCSSFVRLSSARFADTVSAGPPRHSCPPIRG